MFSFALLAREKEEMTVTSQQQKTDPPARMSEFELKLVLKCFKYTIKWIQWKRHLKKLALFTQLDYNRCHDAYVCNLHLTCGN